jgi:hypothetical protein
MTDESPVFDPMAVIAAEKPKTYKVRLHVTDPDGNVCEQEYGAFIGELVNMPPDGPGHLTRALYAMTMLADILLEGPNVRRPSSGGAFGGA